MRASNGVDRTVEAGRDLDVRVNREVPPHLTAGPAQLAAEQEQRGLHGAAREDDRSRFDREAASARMVDDVARHTDHTAAVRQQASRTAVRVHHPAIRPQPGEPREDGRLLRARRASGDAVVAPDTMHLISFVLRQLPPKSGSALEEDVVVLALGAGVLVPGVNDPFDLVEKGFQPFRRKVRQAALTRPGLENSGRRAPAHAAVDHRRPTDAPTLEIRYGRATQSRGRSTIPHDRTKHARDVRGVVGRSVESTFLEADHLEARLGERSRRSRPTGARTDHDDVAGDAEVPLVVGGSDDVLLHGVLLRARVARFGFDSASGMGVTRFSPSFVLPRVRAGGMDTRHCTRGPIHAAARSHSRRRTRP